MLLPMVFVQSTFQYYLVSPKDQSLAHFFYDLTDFDISVGSKIVLYADDILLYRPDGDFVSLQSDIYDTNLGQFQLYDVLHIPRKRSLYTHNAEWFNSRDSH